MIAAWVALAALVGAAVGFCGGVWFMAERPTRKPADASATAQELDRLIGLFQLERARAGGRGLSVIASHIDVVIGSLTRARVALAEGRHIDVGLEVAAIVAADEQIMREGGAGA